MTPMLSSDSAALATAGSPRKASTAAQAPSSGDNPMENFTTGLYKGASALMVEEASGRGAWERKPHDARSQARCADALL